MEPVAANVQTIYLIHHSHTDIGYTHDQPIVWELHRRFIDEAIELCERSADRDTDDAFRWTVETTGVLVNWLKWANDRQIERFVRMAQAGRIEVTAMLANLTPLFDTDQVIESFAPVRQIRQDLGLPVEYAMNSDVNGQNWTLVDVLCDLGIRGFSMAINTHFGGALDNQPCAFHWVGPSGRSILAWNGWSYGLARGLGIGHDAKELSQTGWPALQRWLDDREYPLPILMLQYYDAFGDNGSADSGLSQFVRDWNASGSVPRLRIALPHEWWEAVAPFADRLPILRGDWTDYWNFGCGSSAREQAINRASRSRLFAADVTSAAVSALDGGISLNKYRHHAVRAEAVHAIEFWDEHTWGADCAVRDAADDDTLTQWGHKASYAYTGRSLTSLLARDSVAELARHVQRDAKDQLLIFNPLPWPRIVAGRVPDPTSPRGRADDRTSSRHFQDRAWLRDIRMLKPVEVPAFGYLVVGEDAFEDASAVETSDTHTIANRRFRVFFDRAIGGISGLSDRQISQSLVDWESGLPFFGFVHEMVASRAASSPRNLIWEPPPGPGWKPNWPAERQARTTVLAHQVERSALGTRCVRRMRAPGVENLVQEVFLPSYADQIELTASWDMSSSTFPEATYLAFPFEMESPRAWVDLGGQAFQPELDQLPGACRDYFTAQRWVELANDRWGVTIATPDSPMVQLGGFSFGAKQSTFTLKRATFLGWVTNNYWSTNFRGHQPGRVRVRYVVRPHAGPFDESAAHRFGAEIAVPPLFQHLGEAPVDHPLLPSRQGTLLQLPASPILTLRIKPDSASEGLIIRLLNASEESVEAWIMPGLLSIVWAERCDLLEQPVAPIGVLAGCVRLEMPPRGFACLRLGVRR